MYRYILDNIDRIQRFTAGLDRESFVADEEKIVAVQDAAHHQRSGGKAHALAPELCPAIDWRDVRGIGNRLRHKYHGISVERLWSIVKNHLPH
jgi:uncharacterized protein with HEPN domain